MKKGSFIIFGVLGWFCQSSEAAISLVTTVSAGGDAVSNSTTTWPAANCTGANFLVACPTSYNQPGCGSGSVVTDSVGTNTWIAISTASLLSQNRDICLWYVQNANVGSAMTFTFTTATNPDFIGITAACYSGVATTNAFDVQSSSAHAVGTLTPKPGAVTPSINNELIVTCLGYNNAGTYSSIDSGFTKEVDNVAKGLQRSYYADLIQGSAAQVSPTWTMTGSADRNVSVIATFKPSITGGGVNMSQKRFRLEE